VVGRCPSMVAAGGGTDGGPDHRYISNDYLPHVVGAGPVQPNRTRRQSKKRPGWTKQPGGS